MRALKLIFAAMLIAGPASLAEARRVPKAEAEAEATAPAASDYGLEGKFGVGGALVPAKGSAIPALSGTYWVSDDLALEALLGYGSSSQYNGGTDSAGKPVNDSVSAWGLGIAGRMNLAKPSPRVWFQGVGRLSFSGGSTTHTVLGTSGTGNESTLGLFLGLGFEAYMPTWNCVTLEANTGLNYTSTSTSYSGGGSSISESELALGGGTSVLPLNLALHFYFR